MSPDIVDFRISMDTVNDVQNFSGYANIKRKIVEPFVHITFLLDSGKSNFNLVYLNRTISICQFLKNNKINFFVGIAYRVISEYVEMPKQCPLLKVYLFH